MFERFTDRARRVVVLAQEEARRLNHNYIGTEHLLLGLLAEKQGLAARTLTALGATTRAVRQRVEEIVGMGQVPPTGHIPFTPRAKKVLELANREGRTYIGTEHILLGLLREGEGVGAQALVVAGVSLPQVREVLLGELGRSAASGETVVVHPSAAAVDPVRAPRCPKCGSSLGETAAYRVLEIPEDGGQGKRRFVFISCGSCGVSLSQHPEGD